MPVVLSKPCSTTLQLYNIVLETSELQVLRPRRVMTQFFTLIVDFLIHTLQRSKNDIILFILF